MNSGRNARKNRSKAAGALALACVLVPGAVAHAGDRALGEYLSAECVTCHQINGDYKGIPSIVGWPEQGFIEIMNEYRRKKRDNRVMQTVAGKLSDDEVAALASYFGGVTKVAGDAIAPPGNANSSRKKK